MNNLIVSFTKKSYKACIKKAHGLKDDVSGVAAIEMAFIFPVMLTMLIGLVDVTDGMSANRKVTITANTLGDLISQEPGTTTPAIIDGIFAGAIEIMVPYNGNSVGLEIFVYRKDGGGVVKPEWEYRKSGGLNCGAKPNVTGDMGALMTQNNDLIISRTCYSFSYILGKLFTGNTSFKMEDEMTLRPRKSLQLECPSCTQL